MKFSQEAENDSPVVFASGQGSTVFNIRGGWSGAATVWTEGHNYSHLYDFDYGVRHSVFSKVKPIEWWVIRFHFSDDYGMSMVDEAHFELDAVVEVQTKAVRDGESILKS